MNRRQNDSEGIRAWLVLMLSALSVGPAAASEPGRIAPERTAEVSKLVASELDNLLTLYKHLHANPELSYQEVKTAARLAKELRGLGFEVTEQSGPPYASNVQTRYKQGNEVGVMHACGHEMHISFTNYLIATRIWQVVVATAYFPSRFNTAILMVKTPVWRVGSGTG